MFKTINLYLIMAEQNRRKFDNLQIINTPSKPENEITSKLALKDLSVGERLQLLPIAGKASYAQYIGHIPGVSLLVTKSKTLNVVKGQVLNVRILLQGNLYVFQSTVMAINEIPTAYIHLNYPNKVEIKAIREERRVSVAMDVKVEAKKAFANGSNASQGLLTDISKGGASMEADVQLGVAGDKILLTANFIPDEYDQEISIPCVICQVKGWEDTITKELTLFHGIKFEFANEGDRAIVERYVAQQIRYAKTCNMI